MTKITISKRAAVVIAFAVVLAIPGVAGANHIFTDVTDGNVHAEGIEWVANAQVTSGCGDGTTYCPNDPVTRAQMGTFMYRLSGHAPGVPPSVDADTVDGYNALELVEASPLVIPAAKFVPDGFNADPTYNFLWSSGSVSGTAGSSCLNAAVYLPHGTAIDDITGYGVDDVFFQLWQVDYTDGTSTLIDSITAPMSAMYQAFTLANAVGTSIDNGTNTYWLGICLDSDDSFTAARIDYTLDAVSSPAGALKGLLGEPNKATGSND